MLSRFTICMLILCSLVGCRQSRPREVLIDVPQLNGPVCADLILQSLAATDGVSTNEIAFDFAARTVSVGFDSMRTATKNVEHAIADVGFDANTIRADAAARAKLPAECRD